MGPKVQEEQRISSLQFSAASISLYSSYFPSHPSSFGESQDSKGNGLEELNSLNGTSQTMQEAMSLCAFVQQIHAGKPTDT